MEAKIIFKDKSKITAEVNGSCYITESEPEFPEDLSIVTVKEGKVTTTYVNASVQECASVDGRYWFAFVEESEQERTIRELREDNETLAEAIVELAELIGGAE